MGTPCILLFSNPQILTNLLAIAVGTDLHAGRSSPYGWLGAHAVRVSEEKNTLTLALGLGRWLDPLAVSGVVPDSAHETQWTVLDISTVVLTHDLLDGLGGLVGVVEWDGGDVVVENVGLDNTVEELTTDETEFAVNGSSGTASECPGGSLVVRKRWVGVLEEGDHD